MDLSTIKPEGSRSSTGAGRPHVAQTVGRPFYIEGECVPWRGNETAAR